MSLMATCPSCQQNTQTREGRCENIECPRFNTLFSRIITGLNLNDAETVARKQSWVDRQNGIDARKSRRAMGSGPKCKCGRLISWTKVMCSACATEAASQEVSA